MESKSKIKITDQHEASFSSYLTQEDNFLHKLTHPSISSVPMKLEGTKNEGHQEGEIRVFAAEKYFNMNLENDGPRIIDTLKSGNHGHDHHEIGIQRLRPMSRLGSPSVCSEASSNSQTALLSNPARNSSQTRHQKGNERWFFSGFACNGSCSDKKSVFVDTNVAHRMLPGKEFRKEPVGVSHSPVLLEGRKLQARSRIQAKEGFHSPSFDIMSGGIGAKKEGYLVSPTLNVNSVVQGLKVQRDDQNVIEDDPRKSLEVFGSQLIKKEDIALNLQRKLSVLTWDAIPKAPNLSTTSASSQVLEEDAASDASSDLFEIENISTSTQPMFSKQTSDTISAYAPSESSIEWSVVTASAVEYGEKMEAENRTHPGLATQTRKSRPNSLLGCKSLKAVDVAETTYKKHDRDVKSHLQQEHRIRPDIPRPVRKLPVEIKVKDIDFP